MNSKYRIKFTKLDKLRFIGHLDLLNLFQRAIRRAGLPIAYSQGFNPHQLMSFAAPLPLGMASVSEYVDIELKEIVGVEDIKNNLNAVMPDGLEILEVRQLEKDEKGGAATLIAAVYDIEFDVKFENLDKLIEEIMSQDELLIERTSKRKTKVVDIKPDIFEIKNISEETSKIRVNIATGSQKNLKPELLAEYIYNYTKNEFVDYKLKIKRLSMLKEKDGKFIDL